MNEPRSPGEPTDHELLLGVHAKLDAILVSYHRVLRDRLKDRDAIQRHDRRIETLEHQVALLTQATPNVQSWRPNVADQVTGAHVAIEIAELDLEDEPG